MSPAATLANTAWLAASLPAWLRFRRAIAHPAATQDRLLRQLLLRHADTAYGRAHGFAAITHYAEFARRVPLVASATLAPWIARIQNGEPAVLTRDPVTHLIPTGGSTSARKLIPFTASLQAEFNAALGPWIVDLFRRTPSLLGGPAYWSVSPLARDSDRPPSAVPIGFADDSDYLGGTRATLVASLLAAPSALRHLADVDTFRYLTLLCLLRQPDLRLISVWHPSFLALLLDALPPLWPALLTDLRDGTCRPLASLPAAVRAALRLRPCPARAAELSRADPSNPRSLWPSLRVVSCWAEAHAAPSLAALRARLPGVTFQPKGLLATEAFVTLPFADTHPLALCSHFFEFIADDDRILRAHELRPGHTYEVLVTTGGGLCRYRLGDRVEVTGFLAATPCLRFLGRAGRGSDLCGEKLTEAFVAQSLERVTATVTPPPPFALLAPAPDDTPPHYTLYLETSATIAPGIAARLETALRANPHYNLCRELGQLGPVRAFRVADRGYERFAAAELSRGARLGEIKPVALSPRTDWARHFPASSL
jgi:hypothetical protein